MNSICATTGRVVPLSLIRLKERAFLGFRTATRQDEQELREWLLHHLLPLGSQFEQLKELVYQRLRAFRFAKTAFVLDWQRQEIRCPNQVTIPFSEGKVVHFPKQQCAVCPLRSRCTTSSKGRSISIHPSGSFNARVTRASVHPSRTDSTSAAS